MLFGGLTIISLACCWGVCYAYFAYQKRPTLDAINATILLPIVTLVVSSATGALIAQGIPKDYRVLLLSSLSSSGQMV